MRYFLVGDLHSNEMGEALYLDKRNFTSQKELTKDDIVFQVGDFGYIYYYPEALDKYKKDFNKRKEFASKKYTMFIIPGNHENYDLINKLPLIKKWDGLVYEEKFENGSLYYAKRGEIYTINGKKIFTFSGALSSDISDRFSLDQHTSKKEFRIERKRYGQTFGYKKSKIKISWVNYWKQELPTKEEMDYAISNLEKVNYKVEYVFTHTAPKSIIEDFIHKEDLEKIDDPVSKFLDDIYKKLDFKHWYFGHVHNNKTKGKFTTHYKNKPLEIML